ncbi:DUF3365 domain-containing protein [bacterium]|nr:DUF3365 domain-containing protein [bacterium]
MNVIRSARSIIAAGITAAAALTLSCTGEPVPADTAARAQAALAPLKRSLMKELTGAMAKGGPVDAVGVCRAQVPVIASSNTTEGVEMGRTSHRLRNLENAPLAWVDPLLRDYVENPADREPRTVRIDAEHVGYVEPIHMKALCTACHGEDLDDALRAKLRELYPEDRAVGFREGDFRGLFWVKLREDT